MTVKFGKLAHSWKRTARTKMGNTSKRSLTVDLLVQIVVRSLNQWNSLNRSFCDQTQRHQLPKCTFEVHHFALLYLCCLLWGFVVLFDMITQNWKHIIAMNILPSVDNSLISLHGVYVTAGNQCWECRETMLSHTHHEDSTTSCAKPSQNH